VLKQRLIQNAAATSSAETSKKNLNNRLRQLQQQGVQMAASYSQLVMDASAGIEALIANDDSSSNVNLSVFQALQEQALSDLAAVEVQISTAKVALGRLQELNSAPTDAAAQAGVKGIKAATKKAESDNVCDAHKAEQCPTCGQELLPEARAAREKEVIATLATLRTERETLNGKVEDCRRRLDQATRAKAISEQIRSLNDREKEAKSELTGLEAAAANRTDEANRLGKEIAVRESLRTRILQEIADKETEMTESLHDAETKLKSLQEEENKLRRTIDEVRL
jgi:hypothetical protein